MTGDTVGVSCKSFTGVGCPRPNEENGHRHKRANSTGIAESRRCLQSAAHRVQTRDGTFWMQTSLKSMNRKKQRTARIPSPVQSSSRLILSSSSVDRGAPKDGGRSHAKTFPAPVIRDLYCAAKVGSRPIGLCWMPSASVNEPCFDVHRWT